MGFLSKIFKPNNSAKEDAARIYQYLMQQSRMPGFYGDGHVTDNYDGRIDVLTMHIGCVLKSLYPHGEQGERLAQALFDEMKDDFEIALRELGISDTGVAKRIKPMISHFYARVKNYTEALNMEGNSDIEQDDLWQAFDDLAGVDINPLDENFRRDIVHYMRNLSQSLSQAALGQIALCEFEFPKLS